MALCKYCGEPAGLFSSFHQACKYREERKKRGTTYFLSRAVPYIRQYASGEIDSEMAHELISSAGREWNRSIEDLQPYLCDAWGQALAELLEDGVLDEKEEERLQAFIDDFQLSTDKLLEKGYLQKANKYRQQRSERETSSFLSRAVPYIRQYVSGEIDSEMAHKLISIAGAEWSKSAADIHPYLCDAWGQALTEFLEDGVLDDREEDRLQAFIVDFQLSTDKLQEKGYLQKALIAKLLRHVLNGEEFRSSFSEDSVPVNLQRNEKVAWIYSGTKYVQEVSERRYVRGSRGLSVRLAKGVYLRTSSFSGHPVERRSAKDMGIGVLVLTTKSIYWKSSSDSLRIPYSKIVSFTPCDDGITVVKDSAKALPQTFITGDGWGTYNLAVNLARLY